MKNSKRKLLINTAFTIAVFVYLFSSLIKSIVKPIDVVERENRYANKYSKINLTSYVKGVTQSNIESTLSDQVFLSSRLKLVNNLMKGILLKEYINLYFDQNELCYFPVSDINFYGKDNLVYNKWNFNETKNILDTKIENYNKLIDNINTNFYVYYIEKDTDINFETNKKLGAYDYIKDNINTKNISRFEINNFDEFNEYFYKTDHHWNYKGSYKAYKELLTLLNVDSSPKVGTEKCFKERFSGSKASTTQFNQIMTEEFCAYDFNFDQFNTTINGIKNEYGNQEKYFNGLADNISYGNFYGGDDGEIVFKNSKVLEDNILVIGESYDNAILRLLAEKFNYLISIDLRYYEHYMKKEFDLKYYIKKYNINKVLFIGNLSFFTMEDFMINLGES